MKEYHIPGMALAVVSRGKVVFFDGSGYANVDTKTPVTEHTLFHIGSITKSMTAVGILQLRGQGKLNLADPVIKYLPWFAVGGPYSSNNITLYDLLTQSSGIPTSAPDTVLQALTASGQSSIEAGVRALTNVTMVSQPGTTYAYSNMNYSTLGMVLQQVSGQPYREYMQKHVFDPLGMTHTTFGLPLTRGNGSDAAGLYIMLSGKPVPAKQYTGRQYDFADPYGLSLVSSVDDMAKYVSFQLSDANHNVLSKSSLQEAHTKGIQIPGGVGTYAYGWIDAAASDSIPYVWHNGSIPGVFALVVLYPSLDSGVIELVNTSDVPTDLGINQITTIMAETS